MRPAERNAAAVCILILVFLTAPAVLQIALISPSSPGPQKNAPVESSGGAVGPRDINYTIYDMFDVPWGDWWMYRWPTYATDVILTNQPGNYTMLYYWASDALIWAPYRMNITAGNMTNIDVHDPGFAPVLNPITNNTEAKASVDVYFEYLSWDWWNSTWKAKWGSDPDFFAGSMSHQTGDGWYLGVMYNVTMNREAALEWLGMPLTNSNVTEWWAANESMVKHAWKVWLLDQGNNVSDVYNAYEFPFAITGPYAKLTELPGGKVRLEMDFVNWAYEVLMDKWLTKFDISPHEPWLEDFSMNARFDDQKTDLQLDTACMYNLRAVKANKSSGTGSAWAFEPVLPDNIVSTLPHPVSRYDDWWGLLYLSWYSGDPWFGQVGAQDAYDCTPTWFNLTANETLRFVLPRHDRVIAYEGRGVPWDSLMDVLTNYPGGGAGEFDRMRRYGTMGLGYYITNLVPGIGPENQPMDLNSMYDPLNKVLTIKGPHNFDNSGRGAGAPLYHGAPWIEFNVTYSRDGPYAVAGPDRAILSGQSVQFDGSESCGARNITNQTWTIADSSATKMFGDSPTHAFADPGRYPVTLNVTDTDGLHDEDVMYVSVYTYPSASFDFSPMTGSNLTTFVFNASASTDLVDPSTWLRVRWDWNGDGTWDTGWSSQLVTTHQFEYQGAYNVTCQVVNGGGLTNTSSHVVIVTAQAIPEFSSPVFVVAGIGAMVVASAAMRNWKRRLPD